MNKRLFLSLLTAVTLMGAQAQIVDEQRARQYADGFFRQMDATSHRHATSRRIAKTSLVKGVDLAADAGKAPSFYIFNRGTDDGFVIVSGDERTTAAVLAYSDHGSFDVRSMPDNVRAWLNDYANQIDALRNSVVKGTGTKQLDAPKGNPIVEPLITTQWNQDAPYNDRTPKMSGAHTPVGCVAVAVAQIMNYHRWPEQGTGSIEYEWNNSYLDRDFTECAYDWDNLDVAQLLSDVGVACKMNYGVNSSSAYDVDAGRAFVRYFGYDKGMEYHVRHQLEFYDWKDADWEQMLRDELDARRPILYTGSRRDGRNYIGHAFVCDGYDDAGYFHFNFGWGGTADGWYRVTPVDEDYTDVNEYQAYHSVFTHLQKDAGNPAWINVITKEEYNSHIWTFTSDYIETAFQFINTETGESFYSEPEEFAVHATGVTNTESVSIYRGEPNDYDLTYMNLPDGTYKRYIVYRPKGSDKWTLRNFYYCGITPTLAEEYVWVDVEAGQMTKSPSLRFSADGMGYAKINEEEVALCSLPSGIGDKDVVVPDSATYRGTTFAVKDINLYYYAECKTLTLPQTLSKITCLHYTGTTLDIPEGVETIVDLFADKVTDLVLPSGLKSIGDPNRDIGSLRCANTELTIPEGVEYIRRISNSNNLATLNLPASLQQLGSRCFERLEALKTVNFAPGCQLKELPEMCFLNDKRLKTIELPESLERLRNECFENCGSIKWLAIPASVRYIDRSAFSGCTNLEHIEFAENGNLEVIDGGIYSYEGTFSGCENLEYIEFPSSLKVMNDAFTGSGIVYADLSRTQITSLPSDAANANYTLFHTCHGLETVLLPKTIKTIGSLFNECENVTSFIIPEGTESIASLGASNIQSLVIPASVKTFDGFTCNPSTVVVCEGMTPPEGQGLADYIYASKFKDFTLYVPAGALQAYKDYEFKFGRYNHVYRIMVPIYEMAAETAANVVADADGATVLGSTAEGALVLPSTVTGSDGEVPVTEIAANAFMGNAAITSVDIPASVAGSDVAAKARNHSPRSVVGASAGIGQYAFAYCMNLDTVHVHWTYPETIDETVFRGLDLSELVLIVPDNTTSDYATTSVWKDFGTIVEETALGIDSPTDGPSAINQSSAPAYDLMGRRVSAVRPGIYIQGGKKILVK